MGPQESYFLSLPSGTVIPHLEVDLTVAENLGGRLSSSTRTQGFLNAVCSDHSNEQTSNLPLPLRSIEIGLHLPVVHQQEQFAGFDWETRHPPPASETFPFGAPGSTSPT